MRVQLLATRITTWFCFRRDRRHLLEMDDHQLGDLGLRREDVWRGVPFRTVPPVGGAVRLAWRRGRA